MSSAAQPTPRLVETIVCGTDGSPDAQHAVGFTALLARQLDAHVVLVHAINLLEHLPADAANPGVSVGDWATEPLTSAWSEPLRELSVEHRCVAEEGPPLLAIPRIAEQTNADMIVVASHGRGSATALPLGSTAHGMVQLATRPVIVVPRDAT